jgi:hypothetical protein
MDAPTSARPMPVLPAVPFHDGPAGAQRALRDGVADDEKRRAVLHRLAGIHELRLAEDVTPRGVADLVEPDQRRVPDGGGKVGMKRHDRGLSRKGSGPKG